MRPQREGTVRAALFGALLVGAALVHGIVLGGFLLVSTAVRSFAGERTPVPNEPIQVAIMEPPPPVVEPPPPAPEPEAIAPPPPPKAPPAEPKKPPPPDPIDQPKTPPPPPATPPPPRVVGLSLESTVQGGKGPSFSTGNTRMGTTKRVAAEPSEVKPLPKTVEPPPPPANRVATRIPTAGAKLTKPERMGSVTPEYPEVYRAQELEADVVVELTLDATGAVTAARIVSASPYPAFNELALAAAKRERFKPARRGDDAIPFTLTFTYRFRLND